MAGRMKVAGHKQRGGASFMVQREFSKLGVGRIYRSAGTSDKNKLIAINTMLTALAKDGSADAVAVLRKLKDGRLSFLEVVSELTQRGINRIGRLAESTASIDASACVKWLRENYDTRTTRENYYANYRRMRSFGKPDETMKDLPEIMTRYRIWCVQHEKSYRAWDLALSVCQAWVKQKLGDESNVYVRLCRLERFSVKPDARRKQYSSPRDIMNVCQKLPEDVAAMVWSMALYGAGPKEYMEDGWQKEGVGLHIFGKKHEHRDRIVPLLPNYAPAPAVRHGYRTLYSYVRKASGGRLTPYAMRNAYPRWLSAAGVPYNRVQMYQGHAETSQTDTYAFHNTQNQLLEDALKLEKWITDQLVDEPASTDRAIVTVGKRRGWSVKKRGGYYDDLTALRESAAT
jgi:hypothetical protein